MLSFVAILENNIYYSLSSSYQVYELFLCFSFQLKQSIKDKKIRLKIISISLNTWFERFCCKLICFLRFCDFFFWTKSWFISLLCKKRSCNKLIMNWKSHFYKQLKTFIILIMCIILIIYIRLINFLLRKKMTCRREGTPFFKYWYGK